MQLRAAREVSGKTQAQVAKEAQISESQYQNIEYDKCEPGIRTAIRIADVLGIKSYKASGRQLRTAKKNRTAIRLNEHIKRIA